MQPYLPHDDPNPEFRKQTLESRRKQYFFNYNYISGYPFLDHVPKREKFSIYYWASRSASLGLLPFNIVLAKLRTALIKPVDHLYDFLNLYNLYRRPEQIEAWLADEGFAEQRISGCNPQAIRRLDPVPADFPFSDAHLHAVAGNGRTLAEEAAAGRLYFADFEALAHIKGSDFKGRHRTIPSPRALFWWDRDDEKLHTVGIQVRRRAGARVFLPSDPLFGLGRSKDGLSVRRCLPSRNWHAFRLDAHGDGASGGGHESSARRAASGASAPRPAFSLLSVRQRARSRRLHQPGRTR